MRRVRGLFRAWLPGAASAVAMLLIAGLAPPAGAQETTASEKEAEPAERDPAEDEELLPPSDTGYIDDAIVGTKLRLRYDSAFDADAPDRAEFIYGKCNCFAGFGQDAASPGPAADLDFQELELAYEHALSSRFSLFVEVPFRSVDLTVPGGFDPVADESGLGDLRAGFKYALIPDPERYLTFQLRAYFASGDAAKGLGTDHASIEPGILYHRRLSDRWKLASEARLWHPLAGSSDPVTGASDPNSPVGRVERIPPPLAPPDGADGPDPAVRNDDFAGDVLRLGVGLSREPFGSRVRWAPILELVGWYFVDGYLTPGTDLAVATEVNEDGTLANPPGYVQEADNDTVLNLKLGVRIGLGTELPGSFFVGYGFALTDDILYDGIFRLEYRVGLSGRKPRATWPRVARTSAPSAVVAPGGEPPRVAAPAKPTIAPAPSRVESVPAPAAGASSGPEPPRRDAAPTPVAVRPPAEPSGLSPAAEPAAPAPAPVAPVKAPAPAPEEAVLAAVRSWAQSWSAQDVDAYLASYAAWFRPPDGMSSPAWQAWRRERVSAPSFIRVSLDRLRVTMNGPERATVEFIQHYQSNTYRDTVHKRLVLLVEDGAWKILTEEASP